MLSFKDPRDLLLTLLFCPTYMPSPVALKGVLGHSAIEHAQVIITHDLLAHFLRL